MKTAKKLFKFIGIIIGVIVIALLTYIIYLYASYYRIEDICHLRQSLIQQKLNLQHSISIHLHSHMARPRKTISLEEQIKKQEETVLKVKEKYDSEMMKLKDLYAKRNEEKKKELLKAVENSTKTYEEIMAFIFSEGEKNQILDCFDEKKAI